MLAAFILGKSPDTTKQGFLFYSESRFICIPSDAHFIMYRYVFFFQSPSFWLFLTFAIASNIVMTILIVKS